MLQISNLSVVIGTSKILSDISFKVGRGQTYVILGPSGSGKTTLLRSCCGLQKYEGHVFVNGKNVDKMAVEKRNSGYVSQDQTLFPHMSVFENLAFAFKVRGVDKKIYTKIITDQVTEFSIKNLIFRMPSTLSGGEYQKVAITRSFIYDPSVMLMDEPFAQLDPISKHMFINWLRARLKKSKIPTLYVTHYLKEALLLSDKIIFLDQGKIIFLGSPEGFKKSANKKVRDFINKSI